MDSVAGYLLFGLVATIVVLMIGIIPFAIYNEINYEAPRREAVCKSHDMTVLSLRSGKSAIYVCKDSSGALHLLEDMKK